MAQRRPQLRFVVGAIANSDQPEQSWVEDVAGPWNYRVKASTKLGCRLASTHMFSQLGPCYTGAI
jgi:hypothetical protein